MEERKGNNILEAPRLTSRTEGFDLCLNEVGLQQELQELQQ